MARLSLNAKKTKKHNGCSFIAAGLKEKINYFSLLQAMQLFDG
jgi:hypothetical protein